MSTVRSEAVVADLLARDKFRWMLLAGWFLLLSAILTYVVAAPLHAQLADRIGIPLAIAAFLSYSVAMKRYWIAIALLAVLAAVVQLTILR